jgi:hypothetical protein
VIAKQDDFAIVHDMIQAFTRIGPIAHNIPQAIDFVHLLIGNMRKHRLQCLEITMDITNDRAFHGLNNFSGLMLRKCQNDSLGRPAMRVKRALARIFHPFLLRRPKSFLGWLRGLATKRMKYPS